MPKLQLCFTLTFLMCISTSALAKSACHTLVTNEYFKSSLAPTIATPENIKDANEFMTDAETFCKRMVMAIKTNVTTSDLMRSKSESMMKEAEAAFQNDGDMDKLEEQKFLYALSLGIVAIAEKE